MSKLRNRFYIKIEFAYADEPAKTHVMRKLFYTYSGAVTYRTTLNSSEGAHMRLQGERVIVSKIGPVEPLHKRDTEVEEMPEEQQSTGTKIWTGKAKHAWGERSVNESFGYLLGQWKLKRLLRKGDTAYLQFFSSDDTWKIVVEKENGKFVRMGVKCPFFEGTFRYGQAVFRTPFTDNDPQEILEQLDDTHALYGLGNGFTWTEMEAEEVEEEVEEDATDATETVLLDEDDLPENAPPPEQHIH